VVEATTAEHRHLAVRLGVAVDAEDVEFRVRTDFTPAPPVRPGLVTCSSRSFRYNVCDTGPITGAQLVTQISQSPCIRGRTWGTTRTGIWVDQGCSATFRINPRW